MHDLLILIIAFNTFLIPINNRGSINIHILFYSNSRMRTIVTSLSLFLPFLDLFAALCGNGMLESMLEPHLKETGAGTVDTGISFLVFGCMYMFGNLLFGAVNDYR